MANLETLKKEVDDFKTLLDELKNNVTISEVEKKNKVDSLKSRAETTKEKIQMEIDALSEKTDSTSKKQKEEAEALLKSFDDMVKLQMNVLAPTSAPSSTPLQTSEQTTWDNWNTEKWAREKTKDFVSENWSDVTSWEKWKEEPWKNILRAVGFWVTGYAIYKWVKGLWNRAFWDKDEWEEEWDSEESEWKTKKKKKKSFWKTTAWKILKWTWIWVWVGTLWYWIGKKLHLWWEDEEKPTDASPDEVKYKAYEEFYKDPNNKEAVENYEQLWENVDITYEALYDRELQAWYQDELEMKRIASEQSRWMEHYKWIIPFCLDNKFGSIENILSQNSSMKEAMAWGIREMVAYVKNLWNDFLKTFVDSFLSKLPSWTIVANMSWSLSEKIDKWITSNKNTEKELQFFFRQSIRVQTYLFEKREQLEDKIAEENARKYWLKKEDILKDKELYEKYVEKDEKLQKFLISPISTWMTILKDNAIFDSKVWEDVKESVKNLDKQRDEVLGNTSWWKDILQTIYEKKEKWEALTDAEKQQLWKSCDNIVKDIDDNIMDAVEESAWNLYGDLFRTDDANLRKYLDKSWLEKMFQEYKVKIIEKKWELLNGSLDAEWIASLAQTVNNMLALKKEAVLWAQTIEKDYDENWNIIYRIPWFLTGSVANLVKWAEKLWDWEVWAGTQYIASAWLWTWLIMTIWWTIYWCKTWKWWIAKKWVYIATLPASLVYSAWKWAIQRSKIWRRFGDKLVYWSPKWVQMMTEFKWEEWADKLLKALKLWKISLSDAEEIATRKITWYWGTKKIREAWCLAFDVEEDHLNDFKIREKIFDKYVLSISWSENSSDFLKKLKEDNDVYKRAVKYFDEPSVRGAIASRNFDDVKKEVEKIDAAREAAQSIDWVDETVKPAQELLDNPHYKKLQSDVDAEIKDLEFSKNGQSEAKIKQIDNQITKLKEFKNNINRASVEEVESLEKMYETLIKVKKWKWFFENVDAITKLIAEQSDGINKALNDLDGNQLKKLVKELQADGKLTDISDDAITSLAKVLTDVKTNRVLKAWESLVSAFKILIKYIWKVKSLF